MASVTSTSTKPHKVIGTRPVRHDGVPKVTGEAKYGADMHLPRMLFGKVLRSPHPHAIIKSIAEGGSVLGARGMSKCRA